MLFRSAKKRMVLMDFSTRAVPVFSRVSTAAEAKTWAWRRPAAGTVGLRRREAAVVVVEGVDLRAENVGKETEGRWGLEEPWRGMEPARTAWERVREEEEAMTLLW